MRRLALVLVAGVLVACAAVDAAEPSQLIRTNNSGGNALTINEVAGTPCWRQGQFTYRPAGVPFSECSATTSTTSVAPSSTSTTLASTTTAPASTSTTSTTSSTTTSPPASTGSPTTTVVSPPPTSTLPPDGVQFVETFDGNSGLDRFVHGIYHRDDFQVSQTEWSGDHDLSCGTPDTQRVIHRDQPEESFYLCTDHLMTSVGDTSGYSLAWFKPNQTFSRATTRSVSWDVNVTWLGTRQWWEVVILPVGDPDEVCSPTFSPEPCGLPTWSADAIQANVNTVWAGHTQGRIFGWQNYCFGGPVDPEGCDSKVIRRTFTLTDNGNGTVTLHMPDIGRSFSFDAQFPDQFKVVFKDHNYTPLKDGPVAGLTWHWDDIVIT
jgi:hypothetical protein